MIDNTVIIALVAVATLCTVVTIGLGFLPRPSRASAIWAIAFALAMAGSYLMLTGDSVRSLAMREIAAGLMMAGSALVWVGLRAHRGVARVYLMPTLLVYIAVTVAISIAGDTPWAEGTFRGALIVTAAFSVGTARELFRLGPLHRDEALPLLLASLTFVVLAAAGLIDALLRVGRGESLALDEGVILLRTLGVVGASIYIVCAMTTLLLLTREPRTGTIRAVRTDFDTIARERLSRAERSTDLWWSALDIRLDDPVAIREASSTAAYNHVAARFADDLLEIMPAEADLDRISATRYVVLLPRSEAAARPIMSRLLARVATKNPDQGIDLRLSASIGWAPVGSVGFDLDALRGAAADAADIAQRSGGDRWERAETVTVDASASPLRSA